MLNHIIKPDTYIDDVIDGIKVNPSFIDTDNRYKEFVRYYDMPIQLDYLRAVIHDKKEEYLHQRKQAWMQYAKGE